MTTEYRTNAHGIRFYIEGSADIDDNGHFRKGSGWFAGLVVGRDELGGVWFETREAALDAIANYKEVA